MAEEGRASGFHRDLEELISIAKQYFDQAGSIVAEIPWDEWKVSRDYVWDKLPEQLQITANTIIRRALTLSGKLAPILKLAPLATEADQRDLATTAKNMRAAVLFRSYRHWDAEILHDEGTALGVRPAGQSEDDPLDPHAAKRAFDDCTDKISDILELIESSELISDRSGPLVAASRYRQGTAFIMMWIDKTNPKLDDVCDAVKEVFALFGVTAVRADDIEHQDLITERILSEIATAEFLFADLTGARPSVYYEVGYAHALKKRVILFRDAGTNLHFDLAGYNCPEYSNLRDLKDKLKKRLESLTNRSIPDEPQ